jgi:hypothetical protein
MQKAAQPKKTQLKTKKVNKTAKRKVTLSTTASPIQPRSEAITKLSVFRSARQPEGIFITTRGIKNKTLANFAASC